MKFAISQNRYIEPVLTNGIADEKNTYKRIVTFKSIGYVNEREHLTHTKVVIGTDAVPDQLRYAISTFKRDEKDEAITSINPPETLERY